MLKRVRLTIAPLRYGAGIKGKVIDSLAAGVPCIGTPIAYEGMSLSAQLADCVADTPEGLIAALMRYYNDEEAYQRCVYSALRYAAENYNEVDIELRLREVVRPVLDRWVDRERLTPGVICDQADHATAPVWQAGA